MALVKMRSCSTIVGKVPNSTLFCQRGKKKKKMTDFDMYRKRTNPEELAKEYFDMNYTRIFKEKWPSIRCAMLCRKKYCSIINNFTENKYKIKQLEKSGAYNMVEKLHKAALEKCNLIQSEIDEVKAIVKVSEESNVLKQSTEDISILTNKLKVFEALTTVCLPVKAYIYPKHNLTEFDTPTSSPDGSLQQIFLLDASSMLPVLALDPRPGDSVLDMCAAPGGKFNIIVQALSGSGMVVANDISKSRVSRIKKIMTDFIPFEMKKFIKTVSYDGTMWGEIESKAYNKVLVDAPCTNDRISMFKQEDNYDNIFSNSRKRERSQLPQIQAELLRNGVHACDIGGTVIYSTCTASPLQNEFVIQYALQYLVEQDGIHCEIEDLTDMTSLLEDEFNFFYNNMHVGPLVIPMLNANFGPMFICKLKRLT